MINTYRRMTHLVLAGAFLFIGSGDARAALMTVQEAIGELGVPYVPLDTQHASIPKDEQGFLKQFFDLIERAVVVRVETMQAMGGSSDPNLRVDEFQRIEESVRDLRAPSRLKEVQKLVVDAIKEERLFIEKWKKAIREGTPMSVAGDPLVESSSGKLHAAYQKLMQLYPAEGRNREAMERHLCALDFM